mgnify:CR=1 FL=1
MLCERCGVNSAEVFLVRIVEGEKQVEHVCRKCAKEILPFDEAAKMMRMTFSLEGIMDMQELLKDIISPVFPDLYGENDGDLICPHCGGALSRNMFAGEDENVSVDHYENARDDLFVDEITSLKNEMEIAVRDENYELAAEIRDKIKAIENKEGKQRT